MRTKLSAVLAVVAAIAASVSLAFGVGTASAAPSVAIGGGSGILLPLDQTDDLACTLTTIGHDSGGRLIGLTAGHCGDAGHAVFAEYKPGAGRIGTVRYANNNLDYAVIDFDKSKVNPLRTVGGITIAGINANQPQFPAIACKTGRSTGNTCGVTWFSDGVAHYTQMCVDHGDSGSPVVVGNQLIGMVNAFYFVGCFGPETGTNIGPILGDMGAHGIRGYHVA
jgi:hypothetical protein